MQRTAMAVAVIMAVLGTACQKQEINNYLPAGPSQTAQVTGVSVKASNVGITLNACPAVVTFTAVATGTNVTQTFIWSHTGGGKFSSSGNTASLEVEKDGIYTVTATSTQDSSVSDTATVTATGACRGTPPTGGVNIHFTATPSTINRGERSRLDWDVTGDTSCYADGNWTGTRPLRGSVEVSPIETMNYHLHCVGAEPKTVTVTVIQPTSPTPPTPPGGGGGGGGGTPTPTPPTPPAPGPITVSITPPSFTGPAGATQQFQATCHQNGVQIACGSAPYWHGNAGTVFTVTSTGFVTIGAGPSGFSGTLTARVSFADQTVVDTATITRQ